MDDGATALHDGLHHGRKSTVMRGESLCVITATRLLLLIYIDFLFLEVSHLIFLLLSLSLYFFSLLPLLVSCFSPSPQAFRNALNVLIFAHANTRVSSQQQRLNSSADPSQTEHTTHWHLDSLQPKGFFTLTVKSL